MGVRGVSIPFPLDWQITSLIEDCVLPNDVIVICEEGLVIQGLEDMLLCLLCVAFDVIRLNLDFQLCRGGGGVDVTFG